MSSPANHTQTMKTLLFATTAALSLTGAHAEPAPRPFGYTQGPNGTLLFYKERCQADGADRQWRLGVIVQPMGPRKGCWRRVIDQQARQDSVQFCLVGRSDESAPLHLGNACLWGLSDEVIKGDPLPQRAF